MAKPKKPQGIARWTPADFLDRATELRHRLFAWHEWSPLSGYDGSGPYNLTDVSERTHIRFRSYIDGPPTERPAMFSVMSVGPFVAIDEPGAKLPKSSEMAGVSVPESLTDKHLTYWCVKDFHLHLEAEAGISELWKLLRITFGRVLELLPYSFGDAQTAIEQDRLKRRTDPLATHFVRCRQIERPVVDSFVDAAGRLIQAHNQKAGSLSLDDYNKVAMEVAKTDKQFAAQPNVRRWAKQIGCAQGLVSKLPFYAACAEKAGTRKKGKPLTPKVVSLDAVADAGSRDEELERLIGEQRSDAEPSPLDADHAGRSRKVRAGKKL